MSLQFSRTPTPLRTVFNSHILCMCLLCMLADITTTFTFLHLPDRKDKLLLLITLLKSTHYLTDFIPTLKLVSYIPNSEPLEALQWWEMG